MITLAGKADANSEPYQTSNMGLFIKIFNACNPLAVLAKGPILDVLQGSEYASDKKLHTTFIRLI